MQTMTMTNLAQFTEANLLVPRLSADHHEGVITELAQRLERAGRIGEAGVFVDAVLAHDELAVTVFDDAAFPLAHSDTVRELSFAFGITPHPIRWFTTRAPMISMVVLIAVPAADDTRYLSLVPGFCDFLKNQAVVSQLQRCARPEDMFEVLRRNHS